MSCSLYTLFDLIHKIDYLIFHVRKMVIEEFVAQIREEKTTLTRN